MKHLREFYYPKGATKVADKKSTAVAYISECAGRFYAVGFSGKAQKPSFNYRFKTAERRQKYVAEFFANVAAAEAARIARREKDKATDRGLVVGDILKSVWGYDQTNVDYYEVTALIGSAMVEIRAISATTYETAWAQGRCTPLPGSYIGEPMRKRAKAGQVRIASYAWAHKITPEQTVGSVKVYGSDSWTAYA